MDNFLLASMPSIIALLQCAFCSIGFILNGFLVFVLCRNKDLRSSCCAKLIMAMAIFDCFHEFSLIFIPPILTVSGHQISVQLCFFLLFYGPYALLNSGTLILLISLDRLFAVVHPIRYKTFTIDHKGKYLSTLILLPAIFHWSSIYQNYQFVLIDPRRLVFCQPTDFMGPARIQTELYGSLLCIIATLSVYVGIWAMIKCKVVKKAQHKADRRLFTSLFVLIAIISIFGLPIPLIGKFVLPNLPIGPDFQNILYRCLLQLNKIGQASNAPVLYICSFDYRAAMQKEFSSILCRKKSNSRIFTLQQQNGTFYNGNPSFMNTVI